MRPSSSAPTGPAIPVAVPALAGMFAVAGAVHLARPEVFDAIVPRRLPGPSRFWTYSSGLAELALAWLVLSRRTRSVGGLLSAVFLVAVFPANVRTVRVVRRRPPPARLIAMARLPLQLPLIWLALRVARDDGAYFSRMQGASL